MSLSDFLANRLRSNPSRPYAIEHRHAEGGPWARVGGAGTEEGAREELQSPAFPLDHGDLVRLVDPSGRRVGFWVASARRGLVEAGPVPEALDRTGSGDWEAAWEGPQASAAAMLEAASAVDRRRLALIATGFAERTLHHLPSNEPRPRQAIEAAWRWARWGGPRDEVRRLGRAALEAYRELSPSEPGGAAYAAYAAYNVADVVTREGPEEAAFAAGATAIEAAEAYAADAEAERDPAAGDTEAAVAARAWREASEAYDRAVEAEAADADPAMAREAAWSAAVSAVLGALAVRVRAHLPLSELLLARAGEPSPPPPVG